MTAAVTTGCPCDTGTGCTTQCRTWITEQSAFTMTGHDLVTLAATGDQVASGELLRRAYRRASKRETRTAAATINTHHIRQEGTWR